MVHYRSFRLKINTTLKYLLNIFFRKNFLHIQMNQRHCLFILAVLLFSSCISNQEQVYFQNLSSSKQTPQLYKNQNQYYRLQAGDVLSIRIKALNADDALYLNKESEGQFNPFNEPGLYVNGFTVGQDGFIQLPNLGEVKASGKTVDELKNEIRGLVEAKVVNPSVFVTLVSFKISILGEVAAPGYYFIYNNQATLLEGLALAGDMLEFADRRNIRLIRQTPNGPEVVTLDITDANVLNSKYYFLQPNDAIYIPPLELKSKRSNLANVAIAGLVISALSTGVLIYNAVNNN